MKYIIWQLFTLTAQTLSGNCSWLRAAGWTQTQFFQPCTEKLPVEQSITLAQRQILLSFKLQLNGPVTPIRAGILKAVFRVSLLRSKSDEASPFSIGQAVSRIKALAFMESKGSNSFPTWGLGTGDLCIPISDL